MTHGELLLASRRSIAAPEGTATSLPREEIAERIRQEVTIYGIRIDIAEELQRLTAHLTETRHVLQEIGATRPLAVVRREKVAELREWAESRTVPAD